MYFPKSQSSQILHNSLAIFPFLPYFDKGFVFCGNHSTIIKGMIFISKFNLPGKGDEDYYFINKRVGVRSIPSYYPFCFLDDMGLESIEFSDITIFSGSNAWIMTSDDVLNHIPRSSN